MAIAIFNASAGGKTKLRVVGGTSVPTSATPNTLWINTAATIGKVAIQPLTPTAIGGVSLAAGDVWVQTTRRATWMFVHNSLSYAGAQVFAYSGSAWVIATLAAYYNGTAWRIINDINTLLMIHADPDDAVPGLRDASLTETGVVNFSTTLSDAQYKFAPYSISTASGAYLRKNPFALGTGAFTIECWAYLSSYHGTIGRALCSIGSGSDSDLRAIHITMRPDGTVRMDFGTTASQSTATFTLNAWHHVAIVGNGGASGARTVKVYVDGVIFKTATVDYNLNNNYFYAGHNMENEAEAWVGYQQEIRISDVQRWTGNFTPPAYAYL